MNMTAYGHFKNAVPALRSIVPRYEYPAGSIISLNDTAGWDFEDLARYLADHRDNVRPFAHKEPL